MYGKWPRWVVNIMYSHRYHGHGVIIFIPPLQKSKVYVICALVFSVTWCTAVCTVEMKTKRLAEMKKKKNCKYILLWFFYFIFIFALLCKPNPSCLFCDSWLWFMTLIYEFRNDLFIYWFLLKLLACFDKASPLLYFAQSIFGGNKHKLIVSWAEKENYNGEYEHLYETEQNPKIM